MYSLFAKKESAHEDAIWTCVWGRRPERTETEEVEVEVEVEEEEVSELISAYQKLGHCQEMVKVSPYRHYWILLMPQGHGPKAQYFK